MSTDRTTDFLRELLVRQLTTWLPAALHRSRRATFALAYAGDDAGGAEAALRVVAEFADQVRGRRVTVLVLADGAADLPARLGPVEAELPAEVTVHLLPGDPDRLPVALKAAGAAGAPLFCLRGPARRGDPEAAHRRGQRPRRGGVAARRPSGARDALRRRRLPAGRRGGAGAARRRGGRRDRVRQPLRPEPGGGQGRALGGRRGPRRALPRPGRPGGRAARHGR